MIGRKGGGAQAMGLLISILAAMRLSQVPDSTDPRTPTSAPPETEES